MDDDFLLIDVSRLIWRQWTRRLPTGIDRVCLAYLKHFRTRARAVVQFRGFRRILDGKASDRLFDLLLERPDRFRSRLVSILALAVLRGDPRAAGKIYLNVGHTGLNSPHLAPWIRTHRLRAIFLIHDLIPITHPQFCREGEAERHRQRMVTALRTASGLILNSAATRRDLADFADRHGLAIPRCVVAWLGLDVEPSPLPPSEGQDAGRPYFVMVGTIEARKNHLLILQAWAELTARFGSQAPELVVIGQRGWEADEAISILDNPGPLGSHIRQLPRCEDEAMSTLLSGARALLMPSMIEGFGLPLVEALQLGVPVIASDLPVFREIAGDIPTYIDPLDRKAWVDAIEDYSSSGAESRRQGAMISGFRAPSWSQHFAQVEAFLKGL